jgi:hypothetical protein
VAEGVVVALEAVEVEERQHARAHAVPDHLAEVELELAAIGEAGERVVAHAVEQALVLDEGEGEAGEDGEDREEEQSGRE